MDHKALEPIVEYLKQKNQVSPLESDFVETWNALVSQPFDADAAKQKITSNNLKYPDIYTAIMAMPAYAKRPITELTEDDLKYNLYNQLVQMALKGAFGSMNGRRL